MRQRSARKRKTDYGTIILHWTLAGAFVIAVVTGLRIAMTAPHRDWIIVLDPVLPSARVWSLHMQVALVLVATTIAYAVYVWRAGLSPRIRLDRIRVAGLFGRSYARWGAVNVILYWVFFLALLTEIVTGGLLYFDYAHRTMVDLHWFAMWTLLAGVVAHVLAHWKLGGAVQLLRMFRPAPIQPAPSGFDPAELFALLADAQVEKGGPKREQHPAAPVTVATAPDVADRDAVVAPSIVPLVRDETRRPRPEAGNTRATRQPRSSTLRAHPLATAVAAALAGLTVLAAVDQRADDTLQIGRVDRAEVPRLDGDTSDPVWRKARPVHVTTQQGGNFDGNGESKVEIRAVHDGVWAYFQFVWEDPTRSLKQLPLMKTELGWVLLHDGHERGDEHVFNEDKFSVLLTRSEATLAGDRTFHAGPVPVAEKPGSATGRGLHYTTGDGIHADVWQWKATSTDPTAQLDDSYFGPPAEPTPAQHDGKVPYRGGFVPDPGTPNYTDNFEPRARGQHGEPIQPLRLPRDLAATMSAMGKVDLDPNRGDSDGARWFMMEGDSVPYSAEVDATIPVGTIIPGVIISGQHAGDRGNVIAAARWAAGRWALEVARRLDTNSQYDIPIATGTFMRVAAFDHSQIRHTRHLRPIRLEVK